MQLPMPWDPVIAWFHAAMTWAFIHRWDLYVVIVWASARVIIHDVILARWIARHPVKGKP